MEKLSLGICWLAFFSKDNIAGNFLCLWSSHVAKFEVVMSPLHAMYLLNYFAIFASFEILLSEFDSYLMLRIT